MDERVSAYNICFTTSERRSCSIKRTKPVRVSVRARLLKQYEGSRSIERNVFLFAISCVYNLLHYITLQAIPGADPGGHTNTHKTTL